MPFRYAPIRATLIVRCDLPSCPSWTSRRWFHGSRSLRDDVDHNNHYETLNVHPDASHTDIKRSFYALSKSHHPDHNPSDPHAGRRFMRISEAYSVLGHADKRAHYDRDVMRRAPGGHNHRHRGSYHSNTAGAGAGTSPAGGRPASGLSRRRGTFTGPPPSFFRSGGWGAQGAKRRAAHEESTGGAGAGGGGGVGGMGPGQDPYGRREEVPHFDREAHERTQRRVDERRARRMAGRGMTIGPDTGIAAGFFLVSGAIVAAVFFPFLAFGGWQKGRGAGPPAGKIGGERKRAA